VVLAFQPAGRRISERFNVKAQKLVLALATSAALLVAGWLLIGYRLELFVLPARLKEVLRLQALQQANRAQPRAGSLRRNSIALSVSSSDSSVQDFKGGYGFRIEPVRTTKEAGPS